MLDFENKWHQTYKLVCISNVTGSMYIIHFYCLAVEASFYSDVVECLPVDPATWVRFPAGTGKYFRSTTMAPNVGRQFVAGYGFV